jgi:hypothetical protein
MSTRAEQRKRLKRWLAGISAGHLEGLKVRRRGETQERRKSTALRRQMIKECKKALCRWWAEEFDNQILKGLKGE